MPALHRAIVAPSLARATRVDLVLTLPPAGPDGTSEFRVNGVPFWKAAPFLAQVGETQVWTVKNETKWAHPMHLHGFWRGLRPFAMVWKDTLEVPIDGRSVLSWSSTTRPACGGSMATPWTMRTAA